MRLYKNSETVVGFKNTLLYTNNYSQYKLNSTDNELEYAKTKLANTPFEIAIDNPHSWTNPSLISNAIICFSKQNGLHKKSRQSELFSWLESLICKHIVIQFDYPFSLIELKETLALINTFNIHSLLIICAYKEEYHSDEFGELIMENQVASRKALILNSPFDKNYEDTMFFSRQTELKTNFKQNKFEFNPSKQTYEESQQFHTYFNRKLYIGIEGEIKNAPECNQKHGDIARINSAKELETIISTPEFQIYWRVHKELIDVCKHCEFRHMCIDNRIPIQRNNENWYHTEECNYNPFMGKWEKDEGYKSLAEVGITSNSEEFSINI